MPGSGLLVGLVCEVGVLELGETLVKRGVHAELVALARRATVGVVGNALVAFM